MKKRIFGMLLMGAMVIASMSMFTSCKDYDDDINKNAADITALKAELATLRTTIQGDLTSALASYATKSDLTAAVKDLEKISGLQTKLEAIEKALGETDVKKLATDLAALTGKIDKLADAEKLAAAEKNIELQAAAIEKLQKSVEELSKKGYDDTAIKADIKAIQDQIKAFTFSTDIETLKTNMQNLSNSVDAKLANINILSVLVNKILTSVTLIPQTYINGIEAIQFISVQYTPQVWAGDQTAATTAFPAAPYDPLEYADATDGSTGAALASMAALRGTVAPISYLVSPGTTPVFDPGINANPYARPLANVRIFDHQLEAVRDANGAPVAPVTIDNGQTEAYYRVSPAAVNEDQIDKTKIKMVCTTANTQTRAATLKDNDPVKATFKSLENGVLTVNLEKTVTGLIRYNGEDTGKDDNIGSLMVPRIKDEATGQEAAEIYSEFNLIDETVIEPRIAALNKVGTAYSFNPAAAPHVGNRPMQFHYIDSLHIFRSQVDCIDLTAPGGYLYVKEGVQYDQEFDLLKLVTGCYQSGAAATHTEITKDALKKYGIAFRFGIPARYATPESINQNETNQQDFIKFVDEGSGKHVIKAKLPQGRTDNRASIGKEPIIRVMLVDTVRNNLIDQTYFKVKFVDNTPLKPAVPVEFTYAETLKCGGNTMTIAWEDFIEKVYAQIGDNGLSWQQFRTYYPMANVERIRNPKAAAGSPLLTSNVFDNGAYNDGTRDGIADGKLGGAAPIATKTNGFVELFFLQTTNPNQQSPLADANQLKWTIDEEDIQTILPERSKEFETKIIFKSNERSLYGDVEVTLKFTINLPDKPTIHGYYDNYWFNKYDVVDVMPVQYLTKAYYEQLKGVAAPGGAALPAGAVTADNGNYVANNGTYGAWNAVAPGVAAADGGAYCVYNNNQLNPFTWNTQNTAGNADDRIYDDGTYACEMWDWQFRLNQNLAWVRPDYKGCLTAAGAQEHTTEPLYNFGGADQYNVGAAGIINIPEAPHDAYVLETSQGTPAVWADVLWVNWTNTENGVVPSAAPVNTAWNHDGTTAPYLFADHIDWTVATPNTRIADLINPITATTIGSNPTRSHDKKIDVAVYYAYNQYNAESIKDYTICLVAPLCIASELDGFFVEGRISGSDIDCANAFKMIDFRGYEVRQAAHTAAEIAAAPSNGEFIKYCADLYNYYEVTAPAYNLADIRYGMKIQGGSVVADDNLTAAQGMTAAQIQTATNGNVVLSITQPAANILRFKNNGGSNVEEQVNVFIPATIRYGFGEITQYVKVRLYPAGQAPAARNK